VKIIFSEFANSPFIALGFEKALIHYVRTNGQITSLDRWANDLGINPSWVRHCAHSAAAKGLVKLTRLQNVSGRPYRVTALEEKNEN
jgi:predicted ArsR family transcriptional regulator